MWPVDIDRVAIDSDETWKNGFVPWLESMENKKVGCEDGVFVVSSGVLCNHNHQILHPHYFTLTCRSCFQQATIDPALRILQEESEGQFVKMCASKQKLSEIVQQSLLEVSNGLYQCISATHMENELRETAAQLDSYKNDTCW